MSNYPKHIAYRRHPGGKSFHGVAEDANAEKQYRELVEERGYIMARIEPLSTLSRRERRQFIQHEDLGVRLADDDTATNDLPF